MIIFEVFIFAVIVGGVAGLLFALFDNEDEDVIEAYREDDFDNIDWDD